MDGGSTDACGIASTSIDVSSFDCSDLGPNNVTLTVTDVNGNSSSCTMVLRNRWSVAAPVIVPADIQPVQTGCVAWSHSRCLGVDNYTIIPVAQTEGPLGGGAFPVRGGTIEFTATRCRGNTAVAAFTITVNDTTAHSPVANITVQLDEFGNAAITACWTRRYL